jgi:hypothetical protein
MTHDHVGTANHRASNRVANAAPTWAAAPGAANAHRERGVGYMIGAGLVPAPLEPFVAAAAAFAA